MDNLNQNSGPCTSTVAAQIMAQNRQLAQKYYGPLFAAARGRGAFYDRGNHGTS